MTAPHRPLRAAIALVAIAGLGAACVSGPPRATWIPAVRPSPVPAAASAPPPRLGIAPARQELQVLVISTQLYPGENHLLIDLLDRDGRRLARSEPEAEVWIGPPGSPPSIAVPTEVVRLAPDSRHLFRAIVPLDRPGRWSVAASVESGGRRLGGEDTFTVLEDRGSLPLGAAVPLVDTPTAGTAEAVAALTSNPAPDPFFYAWNLADALAAGVPFAFVIDSFAFRTNEACGGGLGHLDHLHDEMPELLMIHAEPFQTQSVDGVLELDPPGGPPRLAAWSSAFGISEPPWTFVVDAEGRLRGKFEGIVGSDELRTVMQVVLTEAGAG